MTQATTAPRTLEGTKGLRNAPRSGHSLRRRAEPKHRDSERARDAASSPRTGTPPVKLESGHAQPGRAHGEAAPAWSRGRRWFKSAPAGRGTGSTSHTLIGRVAATFLLLAGLLAVVPAQAQTTCNAPSFGSQRQVWTGTVTVGSYTFAGTTLYGYQSVDGTNPFGSMDNAQISHGSNTYTARTITVTPGVTPSSSQLQVVLDKIPTDYEKANLTLYICNQSFAMSSASEQVQTSGGLFDRVSYVWSNTGLDWSSETSRTLYVSAPPPTQAPKLVSITAAYSTVTLTYDQTLNSSSGLAASDFNNEREYHSEQVHRYPADGADRLQPDGERTHGRAHAEQAVPVVRRLYPRDVRQARE